jgi:methyltransferase-like protein/2-polyprenyl-3-methyl-5-hydroxy-6-metoxy-1,4-benzoquinol methylase
MTTVTSYDELPYLRLAFAQTQPNRLAAIARLFGAGPAPPAEARILELGCAQGGNLAPMGIELPGAKLLGIDLSQRQIKDGQATLAATGIANVTLRQADLMAVDESWGKFDYIICHGLYSWVPAEAQAKIIEICSRNLTANGVAYVSYNCNPGWRIRGMVRDMMLFHTAGLKSPAEKVRHARALLDYLAAGTAQKTPYAAVLQKEALAIRSADDTYIYHEHLEANNRPVYFYELMAQAHKVGLMYLAESPIQTMFDTDFDANTVATLNQLGSGNILNVEQYMDFLRNRTFRQTLLVHRGVKLVRNLDWQSLQSMHIGLRLPITATEDDVESPGKVEFTEARTGITFSAGEPAVKAVVQLLRNQAPQFLPFSELLEQARSATSKDEPRVPEMVATLIFRLLSLGIADLTVEPWRCAGSIDDHPLASSLARHQAIEGQPITTLRHQPTDNTPSFLWRLLPLLDGRPAADIVSTLATQAQAGQFQLKREGQLVTDPARLRDLLAADLPMHLGHLQQMALLLSH